MVGAAARRYDGRLSGKRTLRWTNALPRDDSADKESPLTASGMDMAGDCMFLGMVKPTQGRQVVNIVRLSDGTFAGTLLPGSALGTAQGWENTPRSVQAMKRKNGEYLPAVEEDARAKNILYRWLRQAKHSQRGPLTFRSQGRRRLWRQCGLTARRQDFV